MFSKAKTESHSKSADRLQKNSMPPSILASDMNVKGDLYSEGDIQLDGQVDGDIRSRQVTIGKKAVINGSVMGDELRVAGTVNGEITARVVKLTSNARVTGDINHDSLSIEAGAYVQGLCKRVSIDLEKMLKPPGCAEYKNKK